MKHLLFILGDELIINSYYKSYIISHYEEKFKEVNDIRLQSKRDKNLPFELENLLAEYDFITLITTEEYYPTIAKILSTLSDDALVLKDEFLVPDKALFSKDSFLCEIKSLESEKISHINVIKTSVNEELPLFLGESFVCFDYFCLLGMDKESANLLLQTLVDSYKAKVLISELLSDLCLIKISSSSYANVSHFLQGAKTLFGSKFIEGKDPIAFIAKNLIKNDLKISFAESCTGGLCASKLTAFSGASSIFEGSLVSYSRRLKHEWLGVSESVLEEGGVYSERCVYFMLKGVFKTAQPDFALAISGVAEGEDFGVKAGKICVGAMYKDGSFLEEQLDLKGDRNFIREQATLAAFCLLLKLKGELFF